LAEDVSDTDTADGRSSIKANAVRRLGKLVCADDLEFNTEDAATIAPELAEHQRARLAAAIAQVIDGAALKGEVQRIILSGHGEFLTRAALRQLKLELPAVSLTQELGPTLSRCATAHALAVLAREALP
jgi:(4-(4-[2-(gamma-L-glutamylamino)ethyl]phenoxymethyl)furan-2-yl)methanamine synthase